MVALALIAAFGQTEPITITVRAAPLKEVCRRLSEASHQQLEVRGKLREEPLILKLTGVPSKAAMDKIAEVADAAWTKNGETSFVLARTPAQEKAEYAAHIAVRSAAIKASIDKAVVGAHLDEPLDTKSLIGQLRSRKAINDAKPQDGLSYSELPSAGAAKTKLPQYRCLLRLLKSIDPRVLAGVDPEGCLVFSSKPTQMQLPLPERARQVLATYLGERNLMIAAAAQTPGVLAGMSGFSPDEKNAVKPWDGKGFVTVKVIRNESSNLVEASMNVYDSQGSPLVREGFGAVSSLRWDPVTFLNDPVVILSPESKRVHDALVWGNSSQMVGGQMKKLDGYSPPDKATVGLLVECEKHDPLSFTLSDALIETADANGVNLVALPDDSMNYAEFGPKGQRKANDFCAAISQRTAFKISGGWLAVTPIDRYDTRLRRIDRGAMATYLKSRLAKGITDLDAKAALALAQPFLDQWSFVATHEAALGPKVFDYSEDRKALRFYASLTPEQRGGLIDGGSLHSIDLSEFQRSILQDWVFNSPYGRLAIVASPGRTALGSAAQSEPTTGAGKGLLQPFAITAKATTTPTALCYWETNVLPMAPDNLAINMVRHYYPDAGELPFPEPGAYREGASRTITLQVAFEPNLAAIARIMGLDVDMSQPTVGYEALSADFRARYEEELANQKAIRQRAGVKPAGSAGPPPPRGFSAGFQR